jgi:hypothetical protein
MTERIEEHHPAVGAPGVPSDPAEAIDHAMQLLFSCCLSLYRASRTTQLKKDELINSAIEGLDASIRVLRGTAATLDTGKLQLRA